MTFQPNDPGMSDLFTVRTLLPDPLPAEPFAMLNAWMSEARAEARQPNTNAMTLCTIDADGTPSARVVLCRGVDEGRGVLTFYTNRTSRKGRAMASNPRVALVFHWDHFDRQIRVEGRVVEASDATSDAYFESRSFAKRLGAWSSDQSAPIESRSELIGKIEKVCERFGVDPKNPPSEEASRGVIPRPPHWGGYHVFAQAVEIWAGEGGRIHDRAVWRRSLTPKQNADPMQAFDAGAWSATRLQP
ncbi:pdxH [Symbiodinium necroappetens]|uniref:pyridoxal 5'-phosphate synthase n=1 Tax=Symbiodinium necroappetens TaxID=1628268 RepID=A0A812VGZ8_9DINO|nr:pdxH [Symbiodinium necroappetens]